MRAAFIDPFLDQTLFGPLVALFSAADFRNFGAIHGAKHARNEARYYEYMDSLNVVTRQTVFMTID